MGKRKNHHLGKRRGRLTRPISMTPADDARQPGNCMVCGQRLGLPGGYANTEMCGVCALGEAAMMEERGESW